MKKLGMVMIIAVLCVSTSWAGGRWNIETIQSQGSDFVAELSGTGSSYGTNSINVGQTQSNQAERLAVRQSSSLWGNGADSIAVADGSYGQDLVADKNNASLGQGITLSSGTQLTTTPGWCWSSGSTGSTSNSVNVGQTQNAPSASQSECVDVSATITAGGGGGGTAFAAVNTVQNTWTEETQPHCCGGWGR